VQTLTEKLMTFALGRALRYQDMPTVRAIARDAAQNGYTFESIVQGIVRSQAFQVRKLAPLPAPQRTASRVPDPTAPRPRS
jgi:phosphomannomutase